ncbi:hypothetical protein G9F72_020105 [Clostridium estertheticum]|uniref:hypothetical protein n=1 Tax=Clostridium estertheticum TaxID=238834 RepID=UPI0013E991C6|nr:hypothetical protein [Clostridium estertheticum]MBZ9688632.1 hypothetical protein [Clostridium estertheticum]
MLKKFIAYQKLLLNSTPPIDMTWKNPLEILLYFSCIFAVVFMTIYIFSGNAIFTSGNLIIILPMVSIWMINRILNGRNRLFETVPVTRRYTVINIFLLSIIIIFIGFLLYWFSIIALFGLIFGIAYLLNPQSITSPPETTVTQMAKGDLLMVCIFVIILASGIAITFIKNKKLRLSCFAAFTTIGYGLLFTLKFSMPVSSDLGNVEFLESFSIMPQANTILIFVATSTIIICIASGFIGYKLYVGKSNFSNYY